MGKLKKLASSILASKPSGLPARRVLGNQKGGVIIEVLIAGIVLGIAVVGLALMFSWGQTFVLAQGDERVALYLAVQRIESLRAVGFGCATAGSASSAPSIPAGCPSPSTCPTAPSNVYNEICLTAGAGGQSFTRETTVECVVDENSYDSASASCDPTSSAVKRVNVSVRLTGDPGQIGGAPPNVDQIAVKAVMSRH